MARPPQSGRELDHLWLLGDIEYLRASRDLLDNEDLFGPDKDAPTIWPPLDPISAFRAIEDTGYSGALFDPSLLPLPVTDRKVTMNPQFGTITLGPDGRFEYKPAPGFWLCIVRLFVRRSADRPARDGERRDHRKSRRRSRDDFRWCGDR